MDRLNFGTLTGFYAVECGNILGLGGAFYASLCAAGVLSKEEKDKTAEFFADASGQPQKGYFGKLIAVFIQITAMNIMIYVLSIGSIAAVGETIPWKEISLIHCLLLSSADGAGRNLLWDFCISS